MKKPLVVAALGSAQTLAWASSYYIAALQAGVYEVAAELSGFATQRKSGVRLLLGQRLNLDFTLSPGAQEAITVTASSMLVDTTEPAVAQPTAATRL